MTYGIVHTLISRAEVYMARSKDPIHDLAHARRVAKTVKRYAKELRLTQEQRHALVLAAYWHDVSRSFTKRPSLVWMPLLDDMLSAFTLWKETIRHGLFGSTAGMATRLIFCKSLGTGAILSRILMRRRNRIMIDILKDADGVDTLHPDRLQSITTMVESAWRYRIGYRVQGYWFLKSRQLRMRTELAQKEMNESIEQFITWLKSDDITAWHCEWFSEKWVEKKIADTEKFLTKMDLYIRRLM